MPFSSFNTCKIFLFYALIETIYRNSSRFVYFDLSSILIMPNQVMEEQMRLEKAREAEMEMLYRYSILDKSTVVLTINYYAVALNMFSIEIDNG